MNEKTNIGGGIKPHVCSGTGGNPEAQWVNLHNDPRLFDARPSGTNVYELLGKETIKNQELQREKAEIYAALQQSELEATKWRCETEALRKAFADQCAESAVLERQLKYEKMRADCNFERAREVQKELEAAKGKIEELEEFCRVYRNRELHNCVSPEGLAVLRHKAAQLDTLIRQTQELRNTIDCL